MANCSQNSSNNFVDHELVGSKNDLNGNNENSSTETNQESSNIGDVLSKDSHGGARPKVRKHTELNCTVRPVNSTNGRQSTSVVSGEDQRVPILGLANQLSPKVDSDVEDTSNLDSDTNEDLYVYTYKGFGEGSSREELEADLPKSFYQLDVGSDSESGATSYGGSGPGQSNLSDEVAAALMMQNEMASNRRSRSQGLSQSGRDSPDMDFLEMDFDPGESDEESQRQRTELRSSSQEPVEEQPENLSEGAVGDMTEVSHPPAVRPNCLHDDLGTVDGVSSVPLQSPAEPIDKGMVRSQSLNSPLSRRKLSMKQETCMIRGESDPGGGVRNKRRHSGEAQIIGQSSSSSSSGGNSSLIADTLVNMEVCGARLSQRESLLFGISSSSSLRRTVPKFRMIETATSTLDQGGHQLTPSEKVDISIDYILLSNLTDEACTEKTMIWTEVEACKRQVSQIGVSACGATAIVNVFQALEWPYSIDQVMEVVPTRYRQEHETVPKYLFSRSVAGTTHADLIDAVDKLSGGNIIGKFFAMYPKRSVSLGRWLRDWIRKGGVPVATINPQRRPVRPGQTIPDAWHHQMIFGVGPSGVYLTNPLQNVPDSILEEQLCSQSELLVRRSDIILRASFSHGIIEPDCDLSSLMNHPDERWDHFNVLGQVVNVIREEQSLRKGPAGQGLITQTSHIKIPAVYQSGITIFVPVSNVSCLKELQSAPELPLHVCV